MDKDHDDFANANRNNYIDLEKLNFFKQSRSSLSDFDCPYTERLDVQKVRRKCIGPQHLTDSHSCFSHSLLKHGIFSKPSISAALYNQ